MEVPNNSVIAILDKALKDKSLTPMYNNQEYINTDTGKKEQGLILEQIKEQTPKQTFPEAEQKKIGILIFLNNKEPREGTSPIETVFPKERDTIALAYIIQGTYKGDFEGTNTKGLHLILTHKVAKKDLKEGSYNL